VIFVPSVWRISGFSRLRTISAMPNMPIASGTKPMPSESSGMLKVKRCWPVCTSVPTRPSPTPATTIAIDLIGLPSVSTAETMRPRNISEK